ncbi:hypothetical protein DFJ73DRAFT_623501 [Zopfochytrium polystomum]|nr:hypothetical protein DFJ73DRAFT_623501 [Zopfochytrium polystomum]
MPNATLVALSSKVASEVLQVEVDDEQLPQILFATHLPSRARPWAHNYGGHQFGYYSGQLGDGRCISLGQIPIEGAADKAVCLQELQLKGCGKTPYSRFGDGHAILSSTIREFLACEYLAAIGIPTTRSLAVVGGSRAVYRENGVESGACLARVAPSFIRFGTFELFWYRGERHLVRQLADYVVKRHFPSLENSSKEIDNLRDTISVVTRPNLHVTEEHSLNGEIQGVIIEPFAPTRNVDIQLNKYARLFREVVRRTAILVAHWQAVGFVHGVLNTDNMSILGITLDFGPFMFLDVYDPWACSNESVDETGRYRFENQPKMVLWNLSKLGRTLVDLVVLDESNDLPMADGDGTPLDGKDVIRQLLESFEPIFVEKYTDLMRKKIGLRLSKDGDLENLILPLLWIMADAGVDYNGFFLRLCCFKSSDMAFDEELGPPVDPPTGVNLPESYIKWARQYRSRLLIEQAASKSASQIAAEDNRRTERMRKVNPTFTLRGMDIGRSCEKFIEQSRVGAGGSRYGENSPRSGINTGGNQASSARTLIPQRCD